MSMKCLQGSHMEWITNKMASANVPTLHDYLADFFTYETKMLVRIGNRTVGVINRLIQFSIICYTICYVLIYKKGYQEFDSVKSSVVTKVKGVMFYNDTNFGPAIMDPAEYVIPPQGSQAFFVMTGLITTNMQTQTNCPESPKVREALCQNDSYCESLKGTTSLQGHGPFTGKCVPSSISGEPNVCEIFGWCPVENDSPDRKQIFHHSANFTVFIKNIIEFPKFGVRRRNIMDWYKNNSEFSNCRWNGNHPRDKYCPIFVLGDITKAAATNYAKLTKMGGIMEIIIDWTCNLDYSVDQCLPEYSFRHLDKGVNCLSLGFNFRYADHYMLERSGTFRMFRNLHKVYGIQFLIDVRGQAGKFRVKPLMSNIGSGLAILGLTKVMCDFIVLYVLAARDFYRKQKILDIQ